MLIFLSDPSSLINFQHSDAHSTDFIVFSGHKSRTLWPIHELTDHRVALLPHVSNGHLKFLNHEGRGEGKHMSQLVAGDNRIQNESVN